MNNWKKKLVIILISLVLLVSLLTFFINIIMIKQTEKQIVSINNLNDSYDAILVLGCKTNGNSPSLMLSKRLDMGIDVYNKTHIKMILSGDHGKVDYDEVNAMRDYILNNNLPRKDIFLDHAGFNTYDSIYRAKYVFDAKKIVIVTQKFHLYRALYIANKLGLEAVGIAAEDIPYPFIQFKNEVREVLSRDKNFFKVLLKPQSKYLGEKISLDGDGNITEG